MAEEVVNTVTLRVRMQQAVEAEAKKVVAALKSINAAGGNALTGLVTGTVGQLAGIGGIYAVVESLKKAAELARTSETNSAKLSIALDGNISRYKEIQSVVENISKAGVYSQSDLTGVAQQLVERGVPTDQINRTLQVVVDTASGLRIPLQEAAEQVAQTFGGIVPRSLGRAVAGLKDLSPEALKAGEALDLLSKKFAGQDAAFASTAPGREVAALRDIEQGWTDIANAMLPIERDILPVIASKMSSFAKLFEKPPFAQLGEFAQSNLAGSNAIDRLNATQKELDELGSTAKSEKNRKDSEEEKKITEDEYRDKLVSLKEYLAQVDSLHAKDQNDLQSNLTFSNDMADDAKKERQKNSASIDNQLETPALTPDAIIRQQEAINKLFEEEAENSEEQLAFTKRATEAQDALNRSLREQLDLRTKATEESIKSLPANAKTGRESVEDGTESFAVFSEDIRRQTDQIAASLPDTFKLADKIYSPADAERIKALLTQTFADAKSQADKTVKSVQPLLGDLIKLSEDARKEGVKDLATGLTDIETHAKSASQALSDMAESFIKSMLGIINQRLVESAANALLGPVDDKGHSTGPGLLQTGVSAGVGLVKDLLGSFDVGGYTGNTSPKKAVGIVHGNEYVFSSEDVKSIGVPTLDAMAGRRAMNQVGARMFRDRSPRGTAAALASIQANGGMSIGGVSAQQVASMLGRVSDALDNAADAHARPSQAILVNDRETARQWMSADGFDAELAEKIKRNPTTIGNAIRTYSK